MVLFLFCQVAVCYERFVRLPLVACDVTVFDVCYSSVILVLLFVDLKNEPYRRADAVRRSQRKRFEATDLEPSRERVDTHF